MKAIRNILAVAMTIAMASAAQAAILVNIDKTAQRMTVSVDGQTKYVWPVSTGGPGHDTPSGTYTASSMNEVWYSKQWDSSAMPHSIFFTKQGHAIHGSQEVQNLGRAVSHGCVRLSLENATALYSLVGAQDLNETTIVIAGQGPPPPAYQTYQQQPYYQQPYQQQPYYQQPYYQRRPYYPQPFFFPFGLRWF